MERKKFYIAPEMEVIHLHGEYYHRLLFYAGESGYFMSRTAYTGTHFTTLKVSNMGAGIVRLNWTSNNLAAATVWTAD
ncbi:hypothetical protein SAMN05216383_1446 [Prevotella sp. KH2C16]|nr:hypothetical protein SAMN05216383_1446 [Prevotella sp. KH2C16]